MKRLSPGGRLPGPSWGADAPPGTRTKPWGAPGRKAEKVLLPFSGPKRCSHTLALLASRPQHPSPLSALSPKPRYSPHAPVSHPKSGCSTSHLSLPTFLALPVTLGARAPGPRPFPCQERFSPSPGCSPTTTRAVCSSPSSDHFSTPHPLALSRHGMPAAPTKFSPPLCLLSSPPCKHQVPGVPLPTPCPLSEVGGRLPKLDTFSHPPQEISILPELPLTHARRNLASPQHRSTSRDGGDASGESCTGSGSSAKAEGWHLLVQSPSDLRDQPGEGPGCAAHCLQQSNFGDHGVWGYFLMPLRLPVLGTPLVRTHFWFTL